MNAMPNVSRLIEMAKTAQVTTEQREEQRRSFVFGNTAFENRRITRAMVDTQADELPIGSEVKNVG
jgi:hypothetical protein